MNLEELLKKIQDIGKIETKNGIDHIFNIVKHFDDGIDGGDNWSVLDFIVFNWEYGKNFKNQKDWYKKEINKLIK